MSVQGVYIAYPIDQALDLPIYDSIADFENRLIQTGSAAWTFDPGDAFKVSKEARLDDTLPRINRAALANADVVAAFLPAGSASIGVPIEIDRAVSLGKTVVIFSDAKSWMLAGWGGAGRRVHRFNDWSETSVMRAIDVIGGLVLGVTNQHDPDPLLVELDDDQAMPTRAYDDDAGLDLYTSQDTTIAPGAFCDVPCGLRVALPPSTWGLVTGRSSALRRKGLLVHSGVIDAGYRGDLYAGAFNLTSEAVEVKQGERIAQLIVLNNRTKHVMPERVDQLPISKRGVNGFGSSGA